MRNNPGPGKFIVIEGLDGAGTSTQAQLLGEQLSARGQTWVTWQPSERPAGLLIRRILSGDMLTDRRALALLFAADRLDHVYGPEGIAAHLRRGEHVVCDRYYLSSLAYQTLDAGFSWVYAINRQALRPDLTVFLEVPVLTCLERIGVRQGGRKDLFEQQEALDRIRASYYEAMRRLAQREAIQVVDGCGPIARVTELVWSRVQALFDSTLLTAPRDQNRLSRREKSWLLPSFRRLIAERDDLFWRGVRRVEDGIEVEVDTPGSLRPLRVHVRWPEGEVVVVAPDDDEETGASAALVERLAAQVLSGNQPAQSLGERLARQTRQEPADG